MDRIELLEQVRRVAPNATLEDELGGGCWAVTVTRGPRMFWLSEEGCGTCDASFWTTGEGDEGDTQSFDPYGYDTAASLFAIALPLLSEIL